jgi:flagellar hook assembly protein FlgD
VYYSVDIAGPVKIELFSINGAKIGTILDQQASVGRHAFKWNGKTIEGRNLGSMFAVLRMTSVSGSVTRMVSVTR